MCPPIMTNSKNCQGYIDNSLISCYKNCSQEIKNLLYLSFRGCDWPNINLIKIGQMSRSKNVSYHKIYLCEISQP